MDGKKIRISPELPLVLHCGLSYSFLYLCSIIHNSAIIEYMSIIHAIILAVIEGITEFLPISSTGHLILASKLLAIQTTEFTKSFEIFIQLGAIMAVTTLYWHTLVTNRKLWLPLISAFIPTAFVGFTFYPFIKGYLLDNSLITTVSLFIGGI